MYNTLRLRILCRKSAALRGVALAMVLTAITFSQGQTLPVAVAGGEYFFGVDPGLGLGTSIAAPAAVGVPSPVTVPLSAVAALPAGLHSFSLRWRDGDNAWGVPATTWIYKLPPDEFTAKTLAGMEYFLNADPGEGLGTVVALPAGTASQFRTFRVPLGALAGAAPGLHTLSVRYRDTRGIWSAPATTLIVKTGETVEALKIARFEWEWWIGSDFTGRIAGTPIPVSPAVASTEVPLRLAGTQLTAGQTVTVRMWGVAGDGSAGIPAQRTWAVETHAVAWEKSHFTPAETGNAAISGPAADPDGDGASNLLELALGSDPRQTSGVPFDIEERDAPGLSGLTLDFPRIAGGSTAADGTYTAGRYEYCLEELSFAPDGSPRWTAIPPQDIVLRTAPQPADPAFEKATATIAVPAGMSRQFVRLTVKIVP